MKAKLVGEVDNYHQVEFANKIGNVEKFGFEKFRFFGISLKKVLNTIPKVKSVFHNPFEKNSKDHKFPKLSFLSTRNEQLLHFVFSKTNKLNKSEFRLFLNFEIRFQED